MLNPFSHMKAGDLWHSKMLLGKCQFWEFSHCKLHFSETPSSGGTLVIIGSLPPPVPGLFHITHLLVQEDSISSPVLPCPLVPSIAPATRILQNGPRMQAWLLKCRRFHCHLLFMGSWGNCGLERRSYYLPLVSTCVVRPYKKPN